MTAEDALRDVRNEKEQLQSDLETILQQIEDKAPVLEEERRRHQQVMAAYDQVSRQLHVSLESCAEAERRQEEAEAIKGNAERENTILQQQCADLGRQVQLLLKEQLSTGMAVSEHASGGGPAASPMGTGTQAPDTISDLVDFRNITELQV